MYVAKAGGPMHDSAELSVVPTAEVLGVTILPMLLNLADEVVK
jgi:hypothetical protein